MASAERMRALIVGHTGQDGRLLREFLTGKGYLLAGVSSRESFVDQMADSRRPPSIEEGDSWPEWISHFRPDEIYYLAAFHYSAEGNESAGSEEEATRSKAIHVDGIEKVLGAVTLSKPDCRVFYAATSFVFGIPESPVQTERSPMRPVDVYGRTKLEGLRVCRNFRESHGLFVSTGILFNHESEFRGPSFLSQKVIQSAIRISRGSRETVTLGDLKSVVDWGYAPDFVRAFHAILHAPKPGEFIVSTGQSHTVEELVDIVFSHLGLDWREHVVEDSSLLARPAITRIGDHSHLTETTGWRPSCDFGTFLRMITDKCRET